MSYSDGQRDLNPLSDERTKEMEENTYSDLVVDSADHACLRMTMFWGRRLSQWDYTSGLREP